MKITLPYTIKNKAGEKLTFTGITVKDGIEYLEAENEVQPGAGPPMHVHYRQDESLTVVSGRMGYQEPGGEAKYAGPGESALFKAGTPHRFWNAGTDVLFCKGYITPPDNVVYFLSEMYKSIDQNGSRPGMYDVAFLLHRYRSEFDMLGIPGFVRKVLFPVVLFFGNLTGKHRKFADAPPPLYH
ncbi:cupin domain-containing protein [Pontibacter sp. KCTC 32443]|uniref:cupin domain-containing protein n=1 Tax=Pontibacter TaxID=323449 RepID=UPI00164E11C7|nr:MULTISPECIES: cupin domain-containing protein [Pontibacter]MBC5773545.1 cupin domain-containing protein [Pontibacter sp. KCTC 32443]